MKRFQHTTMRAAAAVMLTLALVLTANAGWIHAKAWLAQGLLQHAWAQSDHGRQRVQPWPSADMAPIARLLVPRLDQDLIVLDNDSGQALAFGPGWDPASARPGQPGVTVISAHRDTQFTFLRKLRAGDLVQLVTATGTRAYRVGRTRVVDSRHQRPAVARNTDALLLVTCYPFDAIVPGGPMRFVVVTYPVRSMSPA